MSVAISRAIEALRAGGADFRPVPPAHLRSLEVAIDASLPRDYLVIVEKVGSIAIPGAAGYALLDPAGICAYVDSIWNMEGQAPALWSALPIIVTADGDDIGFLRTGAQFGPELVKLNHETPWPTHGVLWYKPLAASLAAFLAESRQ